MLAGKPAGLGSPPKPPTARFTIMLIGAVTGMLGNLSSTAASFLGSLFSGSDSAMTIYTATWGLTVLGAMGFTIGLLLHTLRRRALDNRISELEAILASRDPG